VLAGKRLEEYDARILWKRAQAVNVMKGYVVRISVEH
jgi:hypothetical protein